ncbi:hypothetical protein OS31_26350 [Dickeya oryzae]
MVTPAFDGETSAPSLSGSEVHKCDLCIGVADSPSCVRVCPTSALTLVTPQALAERVYEKQQCSAWNHADIRLR